jgi:hypothetical protein
MQFGIRRLLIVVAAVAVLCALYVAARNLSKAVYYAQRRQAESVLAEIKGISDIKLHSHVDIVEEVNSSRFSVDGQPNSIIAIGGLGHYEDEGKFAVNRIGKWQFRTFGRRYGGRIMQALASQLSRTTSAGISNWGPPALTET